MFRKASIYLVSIFIFLISSQSYAQTWNLANEMWINPQTNPNKTWYFMKHLLDDKVPDHYILLDKYSNRCLYDDVRDGKNNTLINAICHRNAFSIYGITALVVSNPTSQPPTPPNSQINAPAKSVILHPGLDQDTGKLFGNVIRWTSPITGKIIVSGFINKLTVGYTFKWFLRKNSSTIASGEYNWTNGVMDFNKTVSVSRFDNIYFVWDPVTTINEGGASVDMTITKSP